MSLNNMQQLEIRAVALNDGQSITVKECSNRLNGAKRIPRIVIMTGSFVEDGHTYQAESVTLYGESVRTLLDALQSYYSDEIK